MWLFWRTLPCSTAVLIPFSINFNSSSCQPEQWTWPLYTLILLWALMHLVAYILLFTTPCVKKCDLKGRSRKHTRIFLTTLMYDSVLGFGLLTDPCASLIYQLAFMIPSSLLGLIVFTFFCILSKKVQKACTRCAKAKHIYRKPESPTNVRQTEEYQLPQSDVERAVDNVQVEQITQL